MIHIGFSKTNGPLSRIIRYVTKSKVSHCFIRFAWLGRFWVLEADLLGVVMVPWEKFTSRNTVVAMFAPPGLLDLDLLPAFERLGASYDYAGIVGILWVRLGLWLKRHWNNPISSDRGWFCSELICEMLQAAGIPGTEALESSDITPDDLYHLLGGE
jgi:hypothetical protein